MHCDTLWKLIDLDGQGDLMKNDCHISIPSMKKAGTVVQLFACFTKAADYKKKGGYDAAFVHVQDMVRYLRQQQERYSEDLALAYSWNDVDRNDLAGRISAIMTVEEGGILNGHMERLEKLHRISKQQKEICNVEGVKTFWKRSDRKNGRTGNDRRCIPCIGWNIPGYNGNRKRNGDCVSF